jgi:hypothetical protein
MAKLSHSAVLADEGELQETHQNTPKHSGRNATVTYCEPGGILGSGQ